METALGQKNVEKKRRILKAHLSHKQTILQNMAIRSLPNFRPRCYCSPSHSQTQNGAKTFSNFRKYTKFPIMRKKAVYNITRSHLGVFSLPSSWWFFWTGEGFWGAARTCKPPMEGPAAGVKPAAPVFAPTFNLLKAKPGLLSFPSREPSPLPHYPAPGELFWSPSSVCEGAPVVDLKKI